MPSDTEAPAGEDSFEITRCAVADDTTTERSSPSGLPDQKECRKAAQARKTSRLLLETRELPEPGWLSGQASGRYGTLAAAR